jgi:hypothetical protein
MIFSWVYGEAFLERSGNRLFVVIVDIVMLFILCSGRYGLHHQIMFGVLSFAVFP